MRMRRKPGVQSKLKQAPQLVTQTPPKLEGFWREMFGNAHPLHVELGTGKGAFLAALAEKNPGINYVGVEKVPEVLWAAAGKPAGSGRNLLFIHADVRDIHKYFAPGELGRIYLNFSDPWPKKKHAKRRLTHPQFLELYKFLLAPGGEIHFKTDNVQFFEYSLQTLAEAGFSLARITYDLHRTSCFNVMTEYERKFSAQGLPICRCEAYYS